jgi:hypothetical protein
LDIKVEMQMRSVIRQNIPIFIVKNKPERVEAEDSVNSDDSTLIKSEGFIREESNEVNKKEEDIEISKKSSDNSSVELSVTQETKSNLTEITVEPMKDQTNSSLKSHSNSSIKTDSSSSIQIDKSFRDLGIEPVKRIIYQKEVEKTSRTIISRSPLSRSLSVESKYELRGKASPKESYLPELKTNFAEYKDSPQHKEYLYFKQLKYRNRKPLEKRLESIEDEEDYYCPEDSDTISNDYLLDSKHGSLTSRERINYYSGPVDKKKEEVEITFGDGSKYIGQLIDDTINGYGTFIYPNGSKYSGMWLNGKKHGQGRLDYADCSFYQGTWQNDERHGYGIYTTYQYKYEGNWEHDQKHGKGVITYSNGEQYNGEWKNNYPSGYGQYIFRDGSIYTGYFNKGKRHGKGMLVYADGCTIYDGEWSDDKKEGKAVITFINGIYKGDVRNDSKEGYGIYKYSNGDRYEGQWHNNKKHGKGIYYFNEGGYYKGTWLEGIKHGEGVFETPDGKRYSECWDHGTLISKVRIDEKQVNCRISQ